MQGKAAASSQGLKVQKKPVCAWVGVGSEDGEDGGVGEDGSLTVTALRRSHGKSLPGIVFKVYLYSFVPILIFLM